MKVKGTKLKGGVYHLNLRVPQILIADVGRKHIERSLRTSDAREAERVVAIEKGELLRRAEAAKALQSLAERRDAQRNELVDGLNQEQRALYDAAGGLEGLLDRFQRESRWLERAKQPGDVEALESPTLYEQWVEEEDEAQWQRQIAHSEARLREEGKVLRAVGHDVEIPGGFGLRELLSAYVKAKGTGDQTAEAMGAIVGRFIELHGDIALEDLTIAHLRDYVSAIESLPKFTSSKKLRGQKLHDLLRIAEADGLEPISNQTRAKHVAMLKALTAFAPGQGYLPSDPWAAFKFTAPKGKHSAKKPRAPFSGQQVAAILQEVGKAPYETIDRWAPLLAAYQGARREEIGQLRGSNVFEVDGVWVMRITDEGEGQQIKNAASFRTIPLHSAVKEAGFAEFAAGRPDDEYLFQEAERWGGKLNPMRADARGRLTESYGKRFARMLRTKLTIKDSRLTFHSFRHAWEDAAEDVDMPQTHRRELAGRSKAGDSQAGYGDGPKVAALKMSLDRVDPLGA